MTQMDRLSSAVNALTKNREDELVELHAQRELKKHIPLSTRDRIGGLIDAAYDRMQEDNQDSDELTEQDGVTEMHDTYHDSSQELAHREVVWFEKRSGASTMVERHV